MIRFLKSLLLLSLLLAAPALHAAPAAFTFAVDSTLDVVDADVGDGYCRTAENNCTLRAAVMESNALGYSDVSIVLPAGIFTLTLPPSGNNDAASGDLNLTDPEDLAVLTTITGAGAAATIIDANQLDRAFRVDIFRYVLIEGVTIRNGSVDLDNGEIGGGIFNEGRLILLDSVVSDSRAVWGGGIANFGRAAVSRSTISGNFAFDGGGIHSYRIFPDDTTAGIVSVEHSTISGNGADRGGGIFSQGDLFLTSSTISQNQAESYGGGIYSEGAANLYNVTIAANLADADFDGNGNAGGVANYLYPDSVLNLRNSLVAGNAVGEKSDEYECGGVLTSFGRNLIGTSPTAVGCVVYVDSGSYGHLSGLETIGPLQDNGGLTWTHALLPGSNAIDGGDPQFGCVDENGQALLFDQRYAARTVDGDGDGVDRCDIGAFEFRPPNDYYLPFIRR